MDGKEETMMIAQQTQPSANINMNNSPPLQENKNTGTSKDDGKYFTADTGEPEKKTDLDSPDQRDSFYCGDAIMFYPDAPGCNGSSKSSSKKEKKRRSERSDSKPHRCVTCGTGFKQVSHLMSHVRTHTGEKPFDCEVCGKTFARLDSAVRHAKVHSKEKEDEKEKEEKEKEEEKKEKVKEEPQHPSFNPPIKPSGLPRFTPILRPMLDTSMDPPAKSTRKKAKRSKEGKKSGKNHPLREKIYKCDCGMAFKQQCHLKVHRRIHSGEKPFVCEICGKTFGRKYSAGRHMKTHLSSENKLDLFQSEEDAPAPSTSAPKEEVLPELERMEGFDKPFRCIQCHAAFNQRSHLRNHLRTHSGEKPYKCDTCERSFSRKYSAMRHMRTHTGEKKHKCEFCGNLYSQRFHLRDHLRIHTGEKPFNCPVCDKAFSRKDLAARHLKTHTDLTPGMFDLHEESELE